MVSDWGISCTWPYSSEVEACATRGGGGGTHQYEWCACGVLVRASAACDDGAEVMQGAPELAHRSHVQPADVHMFSIQQPPARHQEPVLRRGMCDVMHPHSPPRIQVRPTW